MKPIKLKIKGINSFIEEQIIDFEKLTDRGLFGVFGPTGSGKTTVLDGITLALYGEVSRKSSNFINSNCDSANVSFEFEISGANTKRYLVERAYKIDKKTGTPKSGKCKVVDITNDINEVLAEKVTSVNDTCKKIIGLKLEDFTRTVVLPQGKFSEFLKLEGKNRREMLERLFNLQEYGDDLTRKLYREIAKEKSNNSELIGELKGYENFSEEIKEEKNNELDEVVKNLNEILLSLSKIEKKFKESEEVWNLQIQFNEKNERKIILREREEEIEISKEKINIAEKSFKVIPYINAYENTLNEIKRLEIELFNLEENLKLIEVQKEDAISIFEEKEKRKENELPLLKLKNDKIKEALDEKEKLNEIINEINNIKIKISSLKTRIDNKENNKENLENDLKINKEKINAYREKINSLKIDNSLKEKVREGRRLQEKLNECIEKDKNTKDKINKTKEEVKKKEKEKNYFLKELDENNFLKEKTKEEFENIIKNSPGNSDDLLNKKDELSINKNAWNKYNENIYKIKDSKNKINKAKEELKEKIEEKEKIEKSIEILKLKHKELEVENLAKKLRESLKEGEVCPVCGATEHHKENIKHIVLENINEIEKEIKLEELNSEKIKKEINKLESIIFINEENIIESNNEIKKLGDDFKKKSIENLEEEFENLKFKINEYEKNKEKLENEIKDKEEKCNYLNSELEKLKAIILEKENNLKDSEKENIENEEELIKIKKEILFIKNETNIDDFILMDKEISEKEKELDKISQLLDITNINYENLNNKLEEEKEGLILLRENMSKGETLLKEKEKSKEEKISSIKNKVSDINNIESELKEVILLIKSIEKEFEDAKILKNKKEKEFEEVKNKVLDIKGQVSSNNTRKIAEYNSLKENLEKENFNSIEEVKKGIIQNRDLELLKDSVKKFDEEMFTLNLEINKINKELDGRKITEEEWIKVEEDKKLKEEEKEEINKVKIRLEEEVKTIENKLLELGDLLNKKEKLEHKLSLLNDLEKLFKGKKFVEFVAATRLKYVSLEASKKLNEISNGNYGLEVDENGKFIIRDYKNGGASRDASTLSGGETFLTSLALALALSAEIQLKGTAPLELFFLDEGFGTLDDNTLELVMSSLEKIHHDKLKIGIISHVESIKNRVPVKLILTPAISGKGGSKVKIERS